MKKFIYQVGSSFEYVGFEAFGDAWKQARDKATELHVSIYRLVIKDENIKQEVYVNGGCFLSVAYAKPENIHIF
jgi:hypothetical protein